MFSAVSQSLKSGSLKAFLPADILAGLTVGVIALPLSMALAIAIGVPPQHGLYTAIVAGAVIALSGGSRVNISGPTAAFVVVLIPIVQQFGLGGLLLSSMLAGMILVLMSLAKLGRLIEVVPYPVVVGFTAGIGVVIATLQINDFLGLGIEHLNGHFHEKLWQILQALPHIQVQEALIGLVTLTTLIYWPKLNRKIPGHLVALLLGSSLAWLASTVSPDFSVATIGSRFQFNLDGITGSGIPPVLPTFQWPWNLPGNNGAPLGISFDKITALLPAAFTIAVLGALESLLCAVVSDGMSGNRHHPNDELMGQGLGNIIAPLFGGIPATAAIARTAANIRAGGKTPVASLVHSLFIILAIVCLAPLLAYIPMASMAALLLMVAWNMSEVKHFIRTVKVAPRDDVITLLCCFSLTVIFDMTIAVAVGMALAGLLFIRKSAALAESRPLSTYPIEGESQSKGVVAFRLNGPLFFGSTGRALKALTRTDTKVLLLDMAEVSQLDMSAIAQMETLLRELKCTGVTLIINCLKPRMLEKLHRVGMNHQDNPVLFSQSMDEAIAQAAKLARGQRESAALTF